MTALGRTARRTLIGLLVIVLIVVVSNVLRPRVEAIEAQATREDAAGDARARGMTDEQASCVADRVDTPSDDLRTSLTHLFECLGADVGSEGCLVDAMTEIMDLESANAAEFIDAEAALDAGDRERIAEAGLRCRGMSAEVATCVTDSMRREFGKEVFAPRAGPQLSDEERQEVDAMSAKCTASALPETQGTAASACREYARSIGAAWRAVAPKEFAPLATASAVAGALERSAAAAPPELAGDVATVAKAARGNAEQIRDSHGDAKTDEAATAAYRMASLEADAQLRIWAACPDLDADLGPGGVDFTDLVFAVGGSQADMEEALFTCIKASGAATDPGDDAGCDDLAQACASGALEACDDIFIWSEPESAYEEVGASCGRRIESGHDLYGRGGCDLLGE